MFKNFLSDPTKRKMKLNDRVLVIKPMEGKNALAVSGLVDPRLFKGENNLHIIMDEATCLWTLKYDKGVVPPVFKQQFTSFDKAYNFAKSYLAKRNIEVVEVVNA